MWNQCKGIIERNEVREYGKVIAEIGQLSSLIHVIAVVTLMRDKSHIVLEVLVHLCRAFNCRILYVKSQKQ